jgi:hypothetical protein
LAAIVVHVNTASTSHQPPSVVDLYRQFQQSIGATRDQCNRGAFGGDTASLSYFASARADFSVLVPTYRRSLLTSDVR